MQICAVQVLMSHGIDHDREAASTLTLSKVWSGKNMVAPDQEGRTFLTLPREIRLLIFTICRNDRWLMVSDGCGKHVIFNYGDSACRKLLQVSRQIHHEVTQVRLPPLSLRFAGRAAFCQFLTSSWSTCPDTGRTFLGSRFGLLVSEKAFGSVKIINLAPGTTEVGYLDLSSLSTWLPNLETLELDLRRESMWAHSRVPNLTRDDILIKEIDWRLGTIFGVDAGALRQGKTWKLVVYADFMLSADPDGNSATRARGDMVRLNIVSPNSMSEYVAYRCRDSLWTRTADESSFKTRHLMRLR